MNTLARVFISILLSFASGVIVFFISYTIAISVSPPYVVDALTGQKHGLMPMGQVFLSLIIAFVIFVFVFILMYRKFIKPAEIEQ